ncbi:HU family DNA-binding protein [Deltaproteobacteria bacterium]|nr:HU family DNA-binding protein [Deltaproteobacteria bacterium]
MSLNKNRIIKDVHKKIEMTGCQSAKSVDATFEIIKNTLESNEDVLITGFGKFYIEDNFKRRGSRYINSNAYIPEAKKVVTFRCSPVLVEKLNKEM